MVRSRRWQKVERERWRSRLELARGFLEAARTALERAAAGASGNPIMPNALLAAIAYADALTIKYGGFLNTGDHARLTHALRFALGDRAEPSQLERLGRIVSRKNRIQYEFSRAPLDEARAFIEQVRRFAEWAEAELARI